MSAAKNLAETIFVSPNYANDAGNDVAQKIENRIFAQLNASSIRQFPKSIPMSEIYPDCRKLVFKNLPYVAYIKKISDNKSIVIDIVHTRRKLPT